jgi:NADPH2:quinone reductase
VLDLVGGPYVAEGIASLALKGRLVLIGMLAGREATLDLGQILSRRLTVRGTVLRSRPLEERIVVTQQFAREVVPWLSDGTVRTRVDTVFGLERIADAHRLVESNSTIGKVVVDMGA